VEAHELLAEGFEANRPHLRAVAYRMLGSVCEAEDAVQESWLRLSRSRGAGIENLSAWLTTVVARVCLDMLRSRNSRREEPLGARMPEPIVSRDMFAVPFDEIAPIVGRSPTAARQLASRARRRVQGATPQSDADLAEQREVVDAFLAAAREGDFEALVAVLDPDVVLRVDQGLGASRQVRGGQVVAKQAFSFARYAPFARPALVNGTAGFVVVTPDGPFAVAGFTVAHGRVVEIDLLAGRDRLRNLDLTVLDDPT
jgi:RNA polymerase sigma factor (sigma-70 family)